MLHTRNIPIIFYLNNHLLYDIIILVYTIVAYMPRYETYTKVKEIYNVSPETVRNWAKRGQIKYKCVQNATRKTWLFDIDSIGEYLQSDTNKVEEDQAKAGTKSTRIIYIRVSSAGQSADLERQRELLTLAFPNTEIISDIGSGLNFHRPGLASLVRKICRDQVSQIIITYKDRLCRFAFELLELVCKEHGCSILVYGDGIEGIEHNDEHELKDDLLSIVNVFVASHNGKRSAALRKERKRLQDANEQHEVKHTDEQSGHHTEEHIETHTEEHPGDNIGEPTIEHEVKHTEERAKKEGIEEAKIIKTRTKRCRKSKVIPNPTSKEEVGQDGAS